MQKLLSLNNFIDEQLAKHKWSKTKQNHEKIRNTIYYTLKTNPSLKQKWENAGNSTGGYHDKVLTSDLAKSLDLKLNSYFIKQQKKSKTNENEIKNALATIDKREDQALDELNLETKLQNKGYKYATNIPLHQKKLEIMVTAIFNKLYPHQEIDEDLLAYDLHLEANDFSLLRKEDQIELQKHENDPIKFYLKDKKS